jgi:hypothetical protein
MAMPKSKEEVQRFIEALEDAHYKVESYSGRGMFGKSCVSIRGGARDDEDNPPVSAWEIAKDLWYQVPEGDHFDVPEPRQDSLGLGMVFYWPSYEWPQEKTS